MAGRTRGVTVVARSEPAKKAMKGSLRERPKSGLTQARVASAQALPPNQLVSFERLSSTATGNAFG
jgi:hypothetical protein